MLRRILPLLLILALLLSACGQSAAPESTEAPARLLESGNYAVYDETDTLCGYLSVTARRLIRYDQNGAEVERLAYSFDESSGRYIDENDAEFRVTQRHKGLVLRQGDAEYLLKSVEELPVAVPEETPEPEKSAEEIYQLALQSSVDVTAVISEGYEYIGTGFFDDENGTVITNYHVIEGASEAYITDADGRDYDVTGVLAWDAERDLAVLATERRGSTPLERREAPAAAGETVYAFGSPLGFTATISDGIVSNAARLYEGQTYIQHTAPISNGNSGGPLLDRHGRVIGVVCAFFQNGQNLNLAIPVAEAAALERGESVPLSELFARTEASSDAIDALYDSDWYTVCIAADLGWELYADVPEAMTDNIEINDDYTGLTADLNTDEFLIYLSADMLEADGEHLDDEMAEGLSEMLTESLSEVIGDELQITSTRVSIGGTEWLLLTGGGEEGGAWFYNYMLACETPDGLGIPMVNLLLGAYSEADLDAINSLAMEILSALALYEAEEDGPEEIAMQVAEAVVNSDLMQIVELMHPELRSRLEDEDLGEMLSEGEESIRAGMSMLEESGYTLDFTLGELSDVTGGALRELKKEYMDNAAIEIEEAVDVPVTILLVDEDGEETELGTASVRVILCDGTWYLEPLALSELALD